jgi:hypothetical protein
VSLFLVHQTKARTLILADSLAARSHAGGAGTFQTEASKLVYLPQGVFAAHAGTWQPAWAMLSDLERFLRSNARRKVSTKVFENKLIEIGKRRFAEFSKRFGRSDFDVRIALVLTGALRDSSDIKDGYSSTISIWEKARDFVPFRSRGQIYFAGNQALSGFATASLEHPVMKEMLHASTLSAAQALVATHAALAKISSQVSDAANVVAVTGAKDYAVIKGAMHALPCSALLEG